MFRLLALVTLPWTLLLTSCDPNYYPKLVDRQASDDLKRPCDVPQPPPAKGAGKLDYNVALSGWIEATIWGSCERDRADGLVTFMESGPKK